ncbi:MAG: hypothetical protein FJ144_18790 [Deltaproteobacteria bacterium]|nr:hypothetical protein [Deltaproteobacteria bacterium]
MSTERTRTRAVALETLVVNAVNLAFGLGSAVLLSRVLGLTGRGELDAAMLWPVLLAFFGNTGVIRATLYFAAGAAARPGAVLGNALALAALQSAVLLVVGFVALPWTLQSQSSEVIELARLYLAVIPLSLCSQNALSTIQARLHLRAFNVLRTVTPAGYFAGCALLSLSGTLDVRAAIWMQLALNALSVVSTLAYVRFAGIASRLELDRPLAGSMLSYGFRVQAGEVSSGLNLRLDQAVMAAWLPPAQLGVYVAAVAAASPAQILATAVRMVTVPLIARAPASDQARLVEAAVRRYAVASLAFALLLALALPALVPLVFGSEFSPAVPVAEVLLLGTVLMGAKDVLAGGAQAVGRPWLASRCELVALVVTAAGLAALLPLFGVMGAAIASVLAYGTALGLLVIGSVREFGLSLGSLARPTIDDVESLLPSLGVRLGTWRTGSRAQGAL